MTPTKEQHEPTKEQREKARRLDVWILHHYGLEHNGYSSLNQIAQALADEAVP